MWLFCEDGFFSAVQREGEDRITVRARARSHLESLLLRYHELSPIIETPKADYPYRVTCSHQAWADVVAAVAKRVSYPNFKDHLDEGGQRGFEQLCHDVWRTMYDAERKIATAEALARSDDELEAECE